MGAAPFTILHPISRRGPVEVFAARDASGTRIAVKRLDELAASRDPAGTRRFRREMAIATALRHPGVASCIATGDDWLAFEWLETALDQLECRRRFREPKTLRAMLAGIADTLAYLHARGVTHADIKPAHVRFRGDRPVLIDFGIASVGQDDPLSEVEFAGSPRWMAPEIVAGSPPTPAADVWSLCAVGSWLLAGAPDHHDDADEILAQRRAGRVEPWQTEAPACADDELRAVLIDGLGPPASRPTAADLAQLMTRSTAG